MKYSGKSKLRRVTRVKRKRRSSLESAKVRKDPRSAGSSSVHGAVHSLIARGKGGLVGGVGRRALPRWVAMEMPWVRARVRLCGQGGGHRHTGPRCVRLRGPTLLWFQLGTKVT